MMRSLILASVWVLVGTGALAAPHKHTKKAPPTKTLVPADTEQLQAAERAYVGPYACELGLTMQVNAHSQTTGYMEVQFKNKTYTMKPVSSPTGALRLEDVKGQTLLIQIADKSMLMDVKAGSRLVDNCVHEKQRLAGKT
jgi:hypothetical protein